MIIIPGPASRKLGQRVAELLGVDTVGVKSKVFPDGEVYLRLLGDVKGEDVAVIQTTAPPQDTNLIELFLLVDAANDLGAKRVTAVVPYLAYARQDRRFLDGEAVSVNTVIRILNSLGIDEFITFNVHAEHILEKFEMPARSLSAVPLLAEYLRERGLGGAMSFAPDKGAIGMARRASDVLKGGYGWIMKERDRETGELRLKAARLDVKGKRVVVFDDIISTGGTVALAVKTLVEQGAESVYAACVHPLLVGDALPKIIMSKARGVVGTDCIPSPVSAVSVAPLIAEALRG
ncbi:TPA: ribose-phosphate diphosphokinase [Candidatus Bathyarchaeota archaeon]|nr:ribose-phosphate diphosphokinase [Candidatus Bathyarchaeota archaeon]